LQQPIQLATSNYRQVRILTQGKPGSTFKVARDPPAPGKKPPLFWIFESGFVQDLPWDPGDWHWQAPSPLGDAPVFGYTAKRGYKNARRSSHSPSLLTFIQGLNLRNSTVNQVIARIWHNARPKKVGTLIWLTLNQGLPVGTWLQLMGIDPICKVCDTNQVESPTHCLLECPKAQRAWDAFKEVWKERRLTSTSLGLSCFSGKPSTNVRKIRRTSSPTTRGASLTSGSPLTSSRVFSCTICGLGGAERTSTTNTPSSKFSLRPGWPRSRSAWPPGRPSEPVRLLEIPTLKVELS